MTHGVLYAASPLPTSGLHPHASFNPRKTEQEIATAQPSECSSSPNPTPVTALIPSRTLLICTQDNDEQIAPINTSPCCFSCMLLRHLYLLSSVLTCCAPPLPPNCRLSPSFCPVTFVSCDLHCFHSLPHVTYITCHPGYLSPSLYVIVRSLIITSARRVIFMHTTDGLIQ